MLKWFRRAFGAVSAIKAVSLITGAFVDGEFASSALVVIASSLLMTAASVALAVGYRPRLSASIIVGTGLVFLIPLSMYNHHLYLLILVALILAVNLQVTLLLKIQLTVVYTFGTLTKINEGFLSGNELHVSMVERFMWDTFIGVPLPAALLIPLSAAVVLAEGFLAVGLWFRRTRWVALILGLGMHGGMLVLLADSIPQFFNLLVYGALMYTLYIPFFADKLDAEGVASNSPKISAAIT